MVNGATWEEETLAKLRHGWQQRKQAEQDLAYWVEYTEALEKFLELDRQGRAVKVNGEQSVDPEALRTKSVREGLIDIAARNKGLLVVQDAVGVLVKAKVFESREQARNAIYSTLHNAKRSFHKERPGVYRLTDRAQPQLTLTP